MMIVRAPSISVALAAALLTVLSVTGQADDDADNGRGVRRFGASSNGPSGGNGRRIGNFKGGHLGASSFGDGSAPGQNYGDPNLVSPGPGPAQGGGQPGGPSRRQANDADAGRPAGDGVPHFSRRVGNTELRQWEVGAGVPVDPSYAYWANWGTNAGLLMEFGWGFPFLGMGTGMPGMPGMPGMMSPYANEEMFTVRLLPTDMAPEPFPR